MSKDFEGRVALITGAGNGIGRQTALEMARRGAIVGVNDLKEEFVEGTLGAIRAEGGQAFGVVRNLSTREDVHAAVDIAKEKGGRLDILVNNAAWVRYQAIPDIRLDTMDRMLDIGFKGVIWGIQAASAAMDEKGGAIVNVASSAAMRSTMNSVVYSGIKSGILGITRAAAAELGGRGIRVNAVCPSAVPTEGTERNRDEKRDATRIARTPLGRLGTVEDIARAICFFAGEDSRFVTSQALLVDGGTTLTNI